MPRVFSSARIGKDGHLHFSHYRDNPRVTVESSDAEQLRRRLYARVPRVQLPELLMAVDSETHFSWELLGRAPSAPEELIPLYSAVLVGAMGLDHTDVAMMIPGVRLSAIRRASHLIEQERGLRRANDGVVEFLLRQPLSNQWGQGYEASSDLMSLDVSRHLWTARVDPKRRRHAVGTYTHVLDRWGIVYDQPLLAATRQAGAAIEGAIRQTITRLARLAVDTHGYVVIWTPRRFRRRSLNQPICVCVCFRRSGYASHQGAYGERRDIDHSDRRVGHTGRRRKRISCVSVGSRVLTQHGYRLCA